MSPRVVHIPLSGRDRRHYAAELRKGEDAYKRFTREAKAAHAAADRHLAEAHRLDCLAYNARLFCGGPDEPSPTIADALHGGVPLLQIKCRGCNNERVIDLADTVWPRESPIHRLANKLHCQRCESEYGKRRRPDLTGLFMRDEPQPTAPAAAKRK